MSHVERPASAERNFAGGSQVDEAALNPVDAPGQSTLAGRGIEAYDVEARQIGPDPVQGIDIRSDLVPHADPDEAAETVFPVTGFEHLRLQG